MSQNGNSYQASLFRTLSSVNAPVCSDRINEDLPGSCKLLFCTFALVLDPGRVDISRLTILLMLPLTLKKTKATATVIFDFEVLYSASVLAVYAYRFGYPALARLASGWLLTFTGWDFYPLELIDEFLVRL